MAADSPADCEALYAEIQEKFKIDKLTAQQRQAMEALMEKKDTFVCSRTGSGKSLCYESSPLLFKDSSVLVIAPLLSIMIEQCEKLNAIGFKATYIGKDAEEDQKIGGAYFDFVFASPENAIANQKWRDIISSPTFQEKLQLIVVDEAHTILQSGNSKSTEDPFQKWFSKIGELRSLCLDVPIMALTATASPLSQKQIMRSLCFKVSQEVIIDSSDRRNIKLSSVAISSVADVANTFNWLFTKLDEQKQGLPRHLVFCSTINDCSKTYTEFLARFGRECEWYNMYHSKTNELVKQKIREDMKSPNGEVCVLICTNAAGMGVNFQDVNNIVHYGLPREMDTFVQQMGRAGRDGSFSQELILLKMNKNHLKRSEPDLVQLARGKEDCRHKLLCFSYLCEHVPIEPKHNCCVDSVRRTVNVVKTIAQKPTPCQLM